MEIAVGFIMAALVIILLWVVPIAVADKMGEVRNRTGWPWGLFLGWIGVAILSCLSYLPSSAEREVRELEAQRQLEELKPTV